MTNKEIAKEWFDANNFDKVKSMTDNPLKAIRCFEKSVKLTKSASEKKLLQEKIAALVI
jgi:hypothetical protein